MKASGRLWQERKIWIAAGSVVALIIAGILAYWLLRPPASLLPPSITRKVQGFTPYFYLHSIPAGYTFDAANVSAQDGILLIPLSNADSPNLVLTEQALPPAVKRQDLQKGGQEVIGTIGPATINSIEGRQLGTMIIGKTLILLNGPGDADKNDMSDLLRGLRPLNP